MGAYFYVYEHYRIMDLAWDSLWTWLIAAVLTDLGYYWVHRAAHGKLYFFHSIPNSSLVFAFFFVAQEKNLPKSHFFHRDEKKMDFSSL